jgi:membrane protein DedA with SNARE-associated domain
MLYSLFTSTISSTSILPYCILFLLTMVEGPVATLIGGALTANRLLLVLPVYFSVVLGNLTADMGWYSLGRFGKLKWFNKFFPERSIESQKINQLTNDIEVHAPKLLFLSKFTTGFPIPTLIATGLRRVPVHRWLGFLVLGELIKSAILISAGYFFSKSIDQSGGIVQTVLWVITGLLLVVGFIWFKFHKKVNASH